MRQPGAFRIGPGISTGFAWCSDKVAGEAIRPTVEIYSRHKLSAAKCRRLAAWLIRAAEWIENKEGGR